MVLRTEGKPRAALDALEPLLSRETLPITYLIVKLSIVEALESAFALGDTQRLDTLLGTIEALRPGERPPLLAAHAARFRARSAVIPDGTDAGFAEAAKLFRELGMIFWLALTQLEHGEQLVREGRVSEADLLLDEARDTFAKLNAQPWLERLAATEPRPVVEAPV